MQVEPGTTQNIPVYAKIIITIISLACVVLIAAWGKIMESIKKRLKKTAAPPRHRTPRAGRAAPGEDN